MESGKLNLDLLDNERDVYAFLMGKARNNLGSNNKLYHYTSFDGLLSILSSKRFRLSRTDLLNDKAEAKIGNTEKAMHQYTMSMTEKKEYISMWAMYGRPSGIKLRLDFLKKEFLRIVDSINNWGGFKTTVIYEPSIDDKDNIIKSRFSRSNLLDYKYNLDPIRFGYVAYLNKEKNQISIKGSYAKSFIANEKTIDDLTGFVKYDAWEFEKEIRLLVELKDGERKYIYLPIDEGLIKTFSITFNPWISDNMKDVIKKELNELAGTDLIYYNSCVEGEIDENRL